jgi:hypothetical protein
LKNKYAIKIITKDEKMCFLILLFFLINVQYHSKECYKQFSSTIIRVRLMLHQTANNLMILWHLIFNQKGKFNSFLLVAPSHQSTMMIFSSTIKLWLILIFACVWKVYGIHFSIVRYFAPSWWIEHSKNDFWVLEKTTESIFYER